MTQEGLVHNFRISNGSTIKTRESVGLATSPATYESDLVLEY